MSQLRQRPLDNTALPSWSHYDYQEWQSFSSHRFPRQPDSAKPHRSGSGQGDQAVSGSRHDRHGRQLPGERFSHRRGRPDEPAAGLCGFAEQPLRRFVRWQHNGDIPDWFHNISSPGNFSQQIRNHNAVLNDTETFSSSFVATFTVRLHPPVERARGPQPGHRSDRRWMAGRLFGRAPVPHAAAIRPRRVPWTQLERPVHPQRRRANPGRQLRQGKRPPRSEVRLRRPAVSNQLG